MWAYLIVDVSLNPASASIITNGDFETGDLTGWTWTPTEHAEPMMTAEVVTFDTSGSGASNSFRVNPGGDQDYESGASGGGTLSQTVHMSSGIEYDVGIVAAIRCMLPLPNGSGGTISLKIDDETLWSWSVTGIAGSTTRRHIPYAGTYTPTVTGPHSVSVSFDRRKGNYPTPAYPTPRIYHYVDDISVVPEPATVLLLSFGGLVLIYRKRR